MTTDKNGKMIRGPIRVAFKESLLLNSLALAAKDLIDYDGLSYCALG